MSRTAIVVVTYNSAEVIGRCLESCLAAGAPEIVVVDNGSSDPTVKEVRRYAAVQLIASHENLGFAGAVNRGIRAVSQPLVLLLNPDAELLAGLHELEAACWVPGVAAAAGLLTDEDGKPQRGFSVRRFPTSASLIFEVFGLNRLWPPNPVNRRYRCLDLDLTLPQDVEQPAGAFLMLRRDAWSNLGGFDEGFYPVWFEDVDFCRRIALAGLRTRFVPLARARHRGGHSFRKASRAETVVWWHQSLLKYSTKHLRAGSRRLVSSAVVVSAALRMVTGMFTGMRSGGVAGAYGKVISLAWKCLWSGRTGAGMPGLKATERAGVGEGSAQLGE